MPYIKRWAVAIRKQSVATIFHMLSDIRATNGIFLQMRKMRFKASVVQRWWRNLRTIEDMRVGYLTQQWGDLEDRRLQLLRRRMYRERRAMLYSELVKRHPSEDGMSSGSLRTATQLASEDLGRRHAEMSRIKTSQAATKTLVSNVADKHSLHMEHPSEFEPVALKSVELDIRDRLIRVQLRIHSRKYQVLRSKIAQAQEIIDEEKKVCECNTTMISPVIIYQTTDKGKRMLCTYLMLV
jgi:hypothetical protein